MKKIVEEWSQYCEDSLSFEDGYFFTLFMDELTIEELYKIFSYFPNSQRLVDKYLKFKNYNPLKTGISANREIIEDLIRKDFKEREHILYSIPAFQELIINPRFKFTEDVNYIRNLILEDVWVQQFYDYVNFQKIEKSPKFYTLNDAFYGATYDFDFNLYLFEPLLKVDCKFEYLFEFKKMGGIYSFTQNEIIFSFVS